MNYDFPHLIISYTKQSKEIFFDYLKPIKAQKQINGLGFFFIINNCIDIDNIVTLKTNNIVMTMRESTLAHAWENKLPTDKPLKVRVCVSLMKCQYHQYIYIDISLIQKFIIFSY